ncbi:MAG: hypothetical protein H6625_08195 [Bdellovibrionaceae bacterium]|nr:hypothetical protein [Pseudobdellovibrionaceae bacterium]
MNCFLKRVVSFGFFLCFCTNVFAQKISDDFLVVEAQSNMELQQLIDNSIYKISKSLIGQQIIYRVLKCQAEVIELHLGVSAEMANTMALECQNISPNQLVNENENFVKQSPLNSLIKTTDEERLKVSKKRTYTFLITERNEWKIDSWTNSSTNDTSIVIQWDKDGSYLIDEARIIEILSHETAIYFDSKYWAGATQFSALPGVKQFFNHFSISRDKVTLALDNPFIAHSLAFLRAFKVEQEITSELSRRNLISFSSKDQVRRKEKIESFLMCKAYCLHKFLQKQAEYQKDVALPLFAYAPSYRARLWTDIMSKTFTDSNKFKGQSSLKLKKLLVEVPSKFYLQNTDHNIHIILESLSYNLDLKNRFPNMDKFNNFVISEVLPVHFKNLEKQDYVLIQQSALEYMTEPLLSGYNIRMSSGPRPRIVVGGF